MPPRTRCTARALAGAILTFATLSGCGDSDSDRALLERFGEVADAPDAEGEVVVRIWDMLDGSSKTTHHVMWGKHKLEGVEIRMDGQEVPERGSIVRVWGNAPEDGVIEVDEIEIVSPPAQPLIDPELYEPRRLGAILVFWDSPGLDNPNAEANLFFDADATSVFYGENSYGKERVVGEVFGPYQIPDPGGCNPDLIAQYAVSELQEHGHDETQYRQLMYHFPPAGCGFAGLANLGDPLFPARDSWYQNAWGCVVRNQEIGHNYGMGHSHSYDCQDDMMVDVPFSDDCTFEEYGDPYDPMGGGCGHMNVAQKTYMGWMEGCNIVTATADGTFNLNALELPCDGTQALRFATYDGRFYWLEYRTALGVFDPQEGVLVHVASEIQNNGPSPYIIDVQPAQTYFMHAGESYSDPMGEVTFTVVEENERYAVIQATFPGGGAGSPECWNTADTPGTEVGNVGTLECADIPFPADNTPPTVSITSPMTDMWYDPGSDFTIIVDAQDNRIVSQVEVYVGIDGGQAEPVYRLNAPPWEFAVTNIPEGEYIFGAVAYDGRNGVNGPDGTGVPSAPIAIHVGTQTAESTGGVDDSGTSGPMTTTFPTTTDGQEEDGSGDDGNQSEDPKGCGCQGSGGSGSALALGVIVLGAVRRRRR